eukprot:CAMPEP_0202726842 /NCGR_PEP_ID=MMETSP1385-20130828/184818_1 /ASSEMBLY_ACC=CAM_ASM_000861 /TAXON_ID=933848 /ORGANISM="Elphidium margaritaceum" /LENGTH=601 /DNA_ID=CAMNT_0049393071 /DNA_START=44 /DNA_END=1850 /DNA_ORIENTATION=+
MTDPLWKHSHEASPVTQKSQETLNQERKEIEHEQHREEIKALKEKKRLMKYGALDDEDDDTQEKLEKSHNQWKDSHAADPKHIKADSTKWDNDWDKIGKQREEIKAIKEKQRISKLEAELNGNGTPAMDEETQKKLEASHNQWKDSHAKDVKVLKSGETLGQDRRDAELHRKREEIKAIKEKRQLAKLAKEFDEELSDDDAQEKLEKSHNQWKDSHARDVKVLKSGETLNQDRRDAALDRKREEIRAIKEKKRLAKLAKEHDEDFSDDDTQEKLQKSHNQWKDSHAKDVKVSKSKETLNQDRRDAELRRKAKKSKPSKKDSHAKAVKVSKSKETLNQDRRDAELDRKREEIRAIKQKKKLQKMQSENDLADRNKHKSQTKKQVGGANIHEKAPKKIAAKERVGNDWNKIEKQRAEIKALKEKKRQEKALKEHLDSPIAMMRARTASTTSSSKKSKLEESATSDGEENTANVGFGGANMHEKNPKKIKANSKNWDNDWEKINKKREEIKAIKEKKKLKRMESDNDLAQRNQQKTETTKKFSASKMHDKTPKKIAAKERVGNDYDKIAKQRAAIKALKEKRKLEKEMGVSTARRTTFGNMHEK